MDLAIKVAPNQIEIDELYGVLFRASVSDDQKFNDLEKQQFEAVFSKYLTIAFEQGREFERKKLALQQR